MSTKFPKQYSVLVRVLESMGKKPTFNDNRVEVDPRLPKVYICEEGLRPEPEYVMSYPGGNWAVSHKEFMDVYLKAVKMLDYLPEEAELFDMSRSRWLSRAGGRVRKDEPMEIVWTLPDSSTRVTLETLDDRIKVWHYNETKGPGILATTVILSPLAQGERLGPYFRQQGTLHVWEVATRAWFEKLPGKVCQPKEQWDEQSLYAEWVIGDIPGSDIQRLLVTMDHEKFFVHNEYPKAVVTVSGHGKRGRAQKAWVKLANSDGNILLDMPTEALLMRGKFQRLEPVVEPEPLSTSLDLA